MALKDKPEVVLHEEIIGGGLATFTETEEAVLKVGYEGVCSAFAQLKPDVGRIVYVIVDNKTVTPNGCAELELLIRKQFTEPGSPDAKHSNTAVKVLPMHIFNKGIRALLSRNHELELELARLREIAPDLDGALRTLEAIKYDPGAGDEVTVELEKLS